MPKIQLELPNKLDKELKHYMIDEGIDDKRKAVIQILSRHLELGKVKS